MKNFTSVRTHRASGGCCSLFCSKTSFENWCFCVCLQFAVNHLITQAFFKKCSLSAIFKTPKCSLSAIFKILKYSLSAVFEAKKNSKVREPFPELLPRRVNFWEF